MPETWWAGTLELPQRGDSLNVTQSGVTQSLRVTSVEKTGDYGWEIITEPAGEQ